MYHNSTVNESNVIKVSSLTSLVSKSSSLTLREAFQWNYMYHNSTVNELDVSKVSSLTCE